MKKFLFTGVIAAVVVSCSTATNEVSQQEGDPTETIQEEELIAVTPNRKMTTEIDGMTCVMGCGGSIRKELLKTGAVSRCSFDFKGIDETSSAMIEFDKDKISADEIAEILSTINDGQFTLGEMSTETMAVEVDDSEVTEETSTSKKDVSAINVSTSSGIQLPNFIDLISDWLVH